MKKYLGMASCFLALLLLTSCSDDTMNTPELPIIDGVWEVTFEHIDDCCCSPPCSPVTSGGVFQERIWTNGRELWVGSVDDCDHSVLLGYMDPAGCVQADRGNTREYCEMPDCEAEHVNTWEWCISEFQWNAESQRRKTATGSGCGFATPFTCSLDRTEVGVPADVSNPCE